MEILMNVWLAFNVVFGLFTGKNLLIKVWSVIDGGTYIQSELGNFLDMLVLVSILAYYFSV